MKNFLLTFCAMFLSVSVIQAQENEEKQSQSPKQEKLQIRVKGTSTVGNVKPDIYVDGKKFDFELELLDPEKIESVDVIKGEKAIKEYNAPNGVLFIKTKKATESNNPKITTRGTKSMVGDKAPMIIIDGEVIPDKEILDKLSPDDIDNIKIFKGEQAMEKYHAPNGVVIVTTKKGKKRKK